MEALQTNIEDVLKDEKIIDVWGRKNPRFEKKYQRVGDKKKIIEIITDYGIGASENTNAKGKVLGAGYEAYIMAYFIGLYSNKRLPLSEDPNELKTLGQPIEKWGNLDSKKNRHAYPGLRSYIFMSLVAKTEIDWIALDKGDIGVHNVANKLILTMEEYANYGFAYMQEKVDDDPGYFFSNRSFLDIFLQLTQKEETQTENEELEEL